MRITEVDDEWDELIKLLCDDELNILKSWMNWIKLMAYLASKILILVSRSLHHIKENARVRTLTTTTRASPWDQVQELKDGYMTRSIDNTRLGALMLWSWALCNKVHKV